MPTFRTVVTGVHDSETGFRTLEVAALQAAEAGNQLILVNAYKEHDAHGHGEDVDPGYQSPDRVESERVLARARARCAEVGASDVETAAVAGEPVKVLLDAVDRHGADLLLVGNYGLASMAGRLLGSVPSGVAKKAPCDVLIAHTTTQRWHTLLSRRHHPKRGNYQRSVVVGVHNSDLSRRAQEKAASLCVEGEAKLVLVGVYLPDSMRGQELAYSDDILREDSYLAHGRNPVEEALYKAEARASAYGLTDIDKIIVRGDLGPGIFKIAEERGADLLVVGNRRSGGAAERALDWVTKRVSRRTATHMLLVH